jgi:hypothetical protein
MIFGSKKLKQTVYVYCVSVQHSRLRYNPRHRESVRDRHKVDHIRGYGAWLDLSKQCAQVLHPHILDRSLAFIRACIEIIHPLWHDVVLQHFHVQDCALILRAHPLALEGDNDEIDHPADPQGTYMDKNTVSVCGTYICMPLRANYLWPFVWQRSSRTWSPCATCVVYVLVNLCM